MPNFAQYFVNHMNDEGIRYDIKDDYVISVTYRGDNLDSIPVFIFFDEDGAPFVQLKCWNVANFKNREAQAISLCNQLNAEYRWVRFYLDDDMDIIVAIDAIIDERTCGDICLSLTRRVVSIVDDAYPTIAKARWA